MSSGTALTPRATIEQVLEWGMALFERLVGSQEPKIGVHGFSAALRLWQKNLITRAQLVAGFGLTAADDPDLDWLTQKYTAAVTKTDFIASIEMLLILAEQNRFGLRTKSTFAAAVDALIV